MLEFNKEHKSLNVSLEKEKKIKIKNVFLCGLLLSSMFLFNGCAKTVPCDVSDLHAHTYVKNNSMTVQMINEKEYTMDGWVRKDDYVYVSEDEKDLIEFLNKKELIKIEENKEAINKIISSHHDYVEYRYKHPTTRVVPYTKMVNGKAQLSTRVVADTVTGWTTNPNHIGLTGEQRVVHYVYFGYKVEKMENGKYKLIASEPVDNIEELGSEYPYIMEYFYKKVLLNNKTLEVNSEEVYEDAEVSNGFGK